MPSKLEQEGKIRKKTPIAWVVWEPQNKDERARTISCAGSDEILQTKTLWVERGKTETGEISLEKVERSVWVPETLKRTFLPRVPEPIYQPEDLQLFRGDKSWKIMSRSELEKYLRAMESTKAE